MAAGKGASESETLSTSRLASESSWRSLFLSRRSPGRLLQVKKLTCIRNERSHFASESTMENDQTMRHASLSQDTTNSVGSLINPSPKLGRNHTKPYQRRTRAEQPRIRRGSRRTHGQVVYVKSVGDRGQYGKRAGLVSPWTHRDHTNIFRTREMNWMTSWDGNIEEGPGRAHYEALLCAKCEVVKTARIHWNHPSAHLARRRGDELGAEGGEICLVMPAC